MDNLINQLNTTVKSGVPVCLCVVIETTGSVPRKASTKMLVFADGRTIGTVGGGGVEEKATEAALMALKDGQTRLVHYSLKDSSDASVGICGGEMTVYIEPQMTQPLLLIIGAGHVGKAVARAAAPLGFRVILTDDRMKSLDPSEYPVNVEFVSSMMADLPKVIAFANNTYIVDVSRGTDVDIEGLPAILEQQFDYLGIIGSLKRWTHTRKGLLDKGVSLEQINRIKSPIGLDIRGETPEEIAISILAEVIAFKNNATILNK
ncbi:MAG: XdhC/CoxI family protein [Anaerolineaceae bacterium]